jgi:V8-like Glu-specific endopeptidase
VDGRQEISATGQPWRSLASRAVALIPRAVFEAIVAEPSSLAAYSMTRARGLCADEEFAAQPSLAHCSGFLLSEDLVLTAGHCIPDERCDDYAYVKDFQVTEQNFVVSVTAQQGRRCARIEASDSYAGNDFALVRLASPFAPLPPIAIHARLPAAGDPVFLLGYPSGLPLKLHGGGAVVWSDAKTSSRFGADFDAFTGDSGGPVFDAEGGLIGAMAQGQSDYVYDASAQCLRPAVVAAVSEAGRYESVVAIGAILGAACRSRAQIACDLWQISQRARAGASCRQ